MKLAKIAIAMLPLCSGVHAADSSSQTSMLVTATRLPQSTSDTLAPYTVINATQIEQMQAKSVIDVLRMQPGVQIRRNGGRGLVTSVSIRGGQSDYTLVLIDGVRAMSATLGSADLDFLPASLVERIEIIRGPRAIQYGADAMSGVINIITRPNMNDERNQVTLGAGQDGYAQGAWNVVHAFSDNTQIHFAVNSERSDGYNFMPSHPPEHHYGYHTEQGLFTLHHQFNSHLEGSLQSLSSMGHSDYNYGGTFSPNSELGKMVVNQQSYQGQLRYQKATYYSQLQLNYGVDDSRTLGASDSRTVTQNYGMNWLNRWELTRHWQLDAGIDGRQDQVGKSSTHYDRTKRYNVGGYSTVGFDNGHYLAQLSLRHDMNQQYHQVTTYSLASGWYYLPRQQIKLSYATAFKAPTFNDLYYPNYGNPDLNPEKSKTIELGFKGDLKALQYELNFYRNRYHNLIGNISGTPYNISESQILGTEFIIHYQYGRVAQQFSYTYLDSENTQTNKVLSYRPWNSAKWQADWQINDQLNLHSGVNWVGHRFSSKVSRLPSYWTLQLAAGYQVTSALKLSAVVHNLLDREYETVEDYQATGLQTDITAKYAF